MKKIYHLFLIALSAVTLFTACEKVKDLPVYANGAAPVLSSSAAELAAKPADSLANIVTFSWTYPNYATDSSNIKYVVQLDSAGGDFSRPYSRTITKSLNTSFTAKELNELLLSYGYAFGVAYDIKVRLVSSYANNNEQLASNVLTVKMTPYKIPPKVQLPADEKLYLVGDASQGGWNNPVPEPSQVFERIDETTYGGVFMLNGGKQYLILPKNGSWDTKYAVADGSVAGLNEGGDFGFGSTDINSNFPGPTNAGWYKIILDFQAGKFKVTPYTSTVPDNLFIVGDATPGGWNNPVPTPSQQLKKLNSTVFQLSLTLTGTKQYLFLPVNGSWDHKYAVDDNSTEAAKSGGAFVTDTGSNFPAPDADGKYLITVDFLNRDYKVVKQ